MNIPISPEAICQSSSRSYAWLSNCWVLGYKHFYIYGILIGYWQIISVFPYPYQHLVFLNSGLFQSDCCKMAFHFLFLFPSSFFIYEHFCYLFGDLPVPILYTFPIGPFLTDCKRFLLLLFVFNIFKIFRNVNEACFYFFFLEFPYLLNNDHYGPKLLWILYYGILLLVNFLKYVSLIPLLKFWGNGSVIYCKYILHKAV